MTTDKPTIAALEIELAEHNRALAAQAAEPALHAKRKHAVNERDTLADLLESRRIARVQIESMAGADKGTAGKAKERLEQLRCSTFRLQAAVSDSWGLLDSYDNAVRSLTFFVENSSKKLATRSSDLKAAVKKEDLASGLLKIAAANLTAIEREISDSKASSEASPETIFA